MRHFLWKSACVASFITLLGHISGAAQPLPNSWVRISTDEYDNVAYVDRASIMGSTRFRYFWTYVAAGAPYPDPESKQQIYATAAYVSTDCQTKRYRLRTLRLFNQSNQITREIKYGDAGPDGFATFHPAAIASINFVCSRGIETPKPAPTKPANPKR